MWHVSSRSGVATLRTAIHLLLTEAEVSSRANGQVLLTTLFGPDSAIFVLYVCVCVCSSNEMINTYRYWA